MNATTDRVEQLRRAKTPAEAAHLLRGASAEEVNHVLTAIGAHPGPPPQPAPALNSGGLVTSNPNDEPILLMRTLDFSRAAKAEVEDVPPPARPTVNFSGEQVPLVMPVINFTPPGSRKNQTAKAAAVSNSTGQEPLLPTPALTFSRR